MQKRNTAVIAEEIVQLLLSKGGSEYIGEPVTKLEHMVQSAEIAEEKSYSEDLILAALLHDIGHVCEPLTSENDMEGLGLLDHEYLGAQFLKERGFSEKIIQAVENHVPAKRYLCYKYPSYLSQLSEASLQTLKLQGGVMTYHEAIRFEQNPFFEDIIAIRKIDEQAKIANKPLPANLDFYKEMMIRHLDQNA